MTKGWLVLILVLGLLLAFSVAVGSATASPGILYAKPSASGSGDCSNWANACTLQHALEDVASYGDDIWVMTGVYTPTTTGTDFIATFQLVNGVEMYGGFAGTESSRDQRNWESNITLLSGDIDDNDITDPSDVITDTANIIGNNSWHVVTSSSVTETCVLDGFTITGGYANGRSHYEFGGGMYNESGSPTLTNVTFSGNSARSNGGGMKNEGSSRPTLVNVTFSGNSATIFGGGMSNSASSSPTLVNVTFSGNSARRSGGGMSNLYNSPTLTDVTFSGNSAHTFGGGMFNSHSSAALTDVTFSGNSAADWGGGMYNRNGSPTLANVTFSGNTAAEYGGGMSNLQNSPTLVNVTFSGNSADIGGGGMHNGNSSATLTNVIFSGNSSWWGGGMRNGGGSQTLTNVTFSGNSASKGGGMYNSHSSPTLTNSILWGNTAPEGAQIYNDTSTPTISYSLVEGSGGSGSGWDANLGSDGGGNIDTDPQFVDADGLDDIVGTLDDNLRLSATSPAIDAGDNSALPADTHDLDGDGDITETLPFDLDGHPRIIGGAVDMGPYEWRVFLTLTKTVTNDDGGTATAGDFQAYIEATPVPWGVAQAVISGTYTISETVQAGYSASAWSGDCAPDGTVTLAIGEHKTCSISNDDIAPTLTLTKTVINDDGRTATAGDFQAYIQGTPVPWGVGQWVISGTYTVSETVQAGYSASAWSGDCATDGTITLAIGDVKTCSITNDDMAPTVTLTKTVINDDDGNATVSDFQAYLDGDAVPWGVPQPVIPGTHTASESVLLGYVPTMWGGDCNEDGTITLNVGEDALCSITNDDTLHSYIPLVLKNYGG